MIGDGLRSALSGARTAYYLVHSMGARSASEDFVERDRAAARNFVEAADAAGLRRVIYLGGLGEESDLPSRHLESRREVAGILRSGAADVTELRAGIVVGAGGASFEMMAQLVERLPVMVTPRWIETPCQPIALSDLVSYLVGCGDLAATAGRSYDVGGPEVLPYVEAMIRIGRALGRPPMVVALPFLTPALSAHWVGFITDVPASLARPIVDGMSSRAVCRENSIRELLPHALLGYDEAVRAALLSRPRAPLARSPQLLPRTLRGRFVRLYRSRPRTDAAAPERS